MNTPNYIKSLSAQTSTPFPYSAPMLCSRRKDEDNDSYDDEEDEDDEPSFYSQTGTDRLSYESDEDYSDRMEDLYGEDWNF